MSIRNAFYPLPFLVVWHEDKQWCFEDRACFFIFLDTSPLTSASLPFGRKWRHAPMYFQLLLFIHIVLLEQGTWGDPTMSN